MADVAQRVPMHILADFIEGSTATMIAERVFVIP